ncbi:MAG: zinc ribbon domain-containing protein [Candidatus Hermodarchaeota archaeon]
MSNVDPSSQLSLSEPSLSGALNQYQSPSDWLEEASFGQGLQRSISILKHQFRWFVLVFFSGGVLMAVAAFPITSIIVDLNTLILNEIFSIQPDIFLLFSLLMQSLVLGLLQNFIMLLGVFVLNVIAVHRVLNTEPSLRVLKSQQGALRFPIFKTIVAGLVFAIILTLAGIVPFVGLVVYALLFFVPILLVLERASIGGAFSLSAGLRRRHWQRILGALVLGYFLVLFAGTLGQTFYLNIEAITTLFGIPLGMFGPVLHILLTQFIIAIVAPILPFFTVAFYAGARGARREAEHKQFMRRIQRQQWAKARLIPIDEQPFESVMNCPKCGSPLRLDSQFCTGCGTKIEETGKSS